MTKGIRALIGVVLVFSLLLSGIGYATLTDNLAVNGSANAEAPMTVYIYDATNVSGFSNVYYGDPDGDTAGTAVFADVTFNSEGKAVLDVKVFNNAADQFMYFGSSVANGHSYSVSVTFANGNEYKAANEATQDKGQTIDSSYDDDPDAISKHDLRITLSGTPNTTLDSIAFALVYRQSEFTNGWVKIEQAADQFGVIINTKTTYEQMMSEMQGYDESGRLNASYIGNVAGAQTGPDNAAINSLFGDYLKIDLDNDGVVEEGEVVTVMIKTANIDGNTNTGITVQNGGNLLFWETPIYGCELILYMTPALLGTTDVPESSYVQTYIVTFRAVEGETNPDGSTKWEQVGETLEGACQVNNYEGGDGNTSVYTDTWRNTKQYTFNGVTFAPQITFPDGFDYRLGYTAAQLGGTGSANLTGANGIYANMLADHNRNTAMVDFVTIALAPTKKEYY